MGRVATGVTGGTPNLLGSLTAAARALPENVEWQAFGTSHTPENCGKPWVWQACTVADPPLLAISECGCDVWIYAPGGGFSLTPPDPVNGGELHVIIGGVPTSVGVGGILTVVNDNLIKLDFDCAGGWNGVIVTGIHLANTAGDVFGAFGDPVPVGPVTIDGNPDPCPTEAPPDFGPLIDAQGKPLNGPADPANFKPFLVEYNAQSCAGIPVDWPELADRARRGLAVRTSIGLAHALSSSAPDGQANQSPSLPTTATVTAGSAGLVNVVAALLQDAVACGLTGEAWIHAPHWTLPHWLTAYDGAITQVGNIYKLGPHTLVLDQGTTGEAPTGQPAAGVGEAWIYITGPVEVAATPVQVLDDTTKGVTLALNAANVIAAQEAIYRFDPCCVFAALAEVC